MKQNQTLPSEKAIAVALAEIEAENTYSDIIVTDSEDEFSDVEMEENYFPYLRFDQAYKIPFYQQCSRLQPKSEIYLPRSTVNVWCLQHQIPASINLFIQTPPWSFKNLKTQENLLAQATLR